MTFFKIFLNNMKQNGLCQPKHNKNTPMYTYTGTFCTNNINTEHKKQRNANAMNIHYTTLIQKNPKQMLNR